MQILFEEEKASLVEQHKRDERALSDMEDRLQVIRRREQELKDELAQVIIFSIKVIYYIFYFTNFFECTITLATLY